MNKSFSSVDLSGQMVEYGYDAMMKVHDCGMKRRAVRSIN